MQSQSDGLKSDFSRLDERSNQIVQQTSELKAQYQQISNEIDSAKTRQDALLARKPQLESRDQQLVREGDTITKDQQRLNQERSAIESARRSLDRTNRATVDAFNQRVNAYNTANDANRRQTDGWAGTNQLQRDIGKYNDDGQTIERSARKSRARLRQATMDRAKNHAAWEDVKRAKQTLEARRTNSTHSRIAGATNRGT